LVEPFRKVASFCVEGVGLVVVDEEVEGAVGEGGGVVGDAVVVDFEELESLFGDEFALVEGDCFVVVLFYGLADGFSLFAGFDEVDVLCSFSVVVEVAVFAVSSFFRDGDDVVVVARGFFHEEDVGVLVGEVAYSEGEGVFPGFFFVIHAVHGEAEVLYRCSCEAVVVVVGGEPESDAVVFVVRAVEGGRGVLVGDGDRGGLAVGGFDVELLAGEDGVACFFGDDEVEGVVV